MNAHTHPLRRFFIVPMRRTHSVIRYGDVMLTVLPALPLLSAAGIARYIGVFALAVVAIVLMLRLRLTATAGANKVAALLLMILIPLGVVLGGTVTLQSLVQALQIGLVSVTILVVPGVRISRVGRSLAVAGAVALSVAAVIDFALPSIGLYENPNGFGLAALCWIAIILRLLSGCGSLLSQALSFSLLSAPAWILVFGSGSRSSIAAAIALVVLGGVLGVLQNARIRLTLSVAILALPFLLLAMVLTGVLADFAESIPLLGEKSAFSGRDLIWATILAELAANGFQGFGLGALPGGLLEGHYEGLSAHNGFIQLAYQFGFIGLSLFFLGCVSLFVWLSNHVRSSVGLAIFLGALIHEMFEVSLIQNHFGPGMVFWVVALLSTALPPGHLKQ